MKINYTNLNGKRSTITLSDALIDTWLMTRPEIRHDDDLEKGLEKLREYIETTPHEKGSTFVQSVECFLLADIRDYMMGLEIKHWRLEQEQDGIPF